MNDKRNYQDTVSAINEVLHVEKEMLKSLEECKTRSKQIVHETHDKAKAIRHRADHRINWIRRRCTEAVNALKANAVANESSVSATKPQEKQSLEQAIEQIAAKLTGPDHHAREQ